MRNTVTAISRSSQESNWSKLLGNKSAANPLLNENSSFGSKISSGDKRVSVAWLRQPGVDYTKVNRLFNRCIGAGLTIELAEGIDSVNQLDEHIETLIDADLIVLEAFGRVGKESYEALLEQVRRFSFVPIVLLTEDASSERTITALRSGADAVLLLNMPEEVVIARLHSLLRRWIFPPAHPTQTVD